MRIRVDRFEGIDGPEVRVVAVAGVEVLSLPKKNPLPLLLGIFGVGRSDAGLNQGKTLPHRFPARIGGMSQHGSRLGESPQKSMAGGELKRRIPAPGVVAVAFVFGTHGNREKPGSIGPLVGHGMVTLKGSDKKGPCKFLEKFFIPAMPVSVPAKESHPCGAGLIDETRPKGTHRLTAIVHRMGKQHGARSFEKPLPGTLKLRQPRLKKRPKRGSVRNPVAPQCGGVDHLDVDVEVVVRAPWGEPDLLQERTLQCAGKALGRRATGLHVESEIDHFLQVLRRDFHLWHRVPVVRPPACGRFTAVGRATDCRLAGEFRRIATHMRSDDPFVAVAEDHNREGIVRGQPLLESALLFTAPLGRWFNADRRNLLSHPFPAGPEAERFHRIRQRKDRLFGIRGLNHGALGKRVAVAEGDANAALAHFQCGGFDHPTLGERDFKASSSDLARDGRLGLGFLAEDVVHGRVVAALQQAAQPGVGGFFGKGISAPVVPKTRPSDCDIQNRLASPNEKSLGAVAKGGSGVGAVKRESPAEVFIHETSFR